MPKRIPSRTPAETAGRAPTDERYRAFAREFVKCHKKAQAAILAGFPAKSAGAAASRLLRNVKVLTFIRELEEGAEKRTAVQIDQVVKEAEKIARFDLGSLFEQLEDGTLKMKRLDQVETSVLSHISVTTESIEDESGRMVVRQVVSAKPHSKNQAIQTLLKHFGALKDVVEVKGSNGGPVKVEAEVIHQVVDKLLGS